MPEQRQHREFNEYMHYALQTGLAEQDIKHAKE